DSSGVEVRARRENVKADEQERENPGDALQGVLVVALVRVVVGLRGGGDDDSVNCVVQNRNPQHQRFHRNLKRNVAGELGLLPPSSAALQHKRIFEQVEK